MKYSIEFMSAVDILMSPSIEGGYVNDPKDPGGETKYGISKRSYPHVNIKALTKETAVDIYFKDFWRPWMAIHSELSYQLLSAAVNSGLPQAARWLQAALGVADDGDVGPVTIAALRKAQPAPTLVVFIAERLFFMTRLKNWPSHGRGWANRIALELEIASVELRTPKIKR